MRNALTLPQNLSEKTKNTIISSKAIILTFILPHQLIQRLYLLSISLFWCKLHLKLLKPESLEYSVEGFSLQKHFNIS